MVGEGPRTTLFQERLDREFYEAVHDELHALAQRVLRGEARRIAEPTSLVNEAYMRLEKNAAHSPRLRDRAYFFAAAAIAMRRILAERGRARRPCASLGSGFDGDSPRVGVDAVELNDALNKLQEIDELGYSIVMLRYYAGRSNREIAGLLGIHRNTVRNRWLSAKLWLYAEFQT